MAIQHPWKFPYCMANLSTPIVIINKTEINLIIEKKMKIWM